MTTSRTAFACVLTSIILFSCNNKKNNTANHIASAVHWDTVSVLPDEAVDINAFNQGYVDDATQHFTAAERKISVIKGKKGLKVTLDPAILEKVDGSAVDGKVNVSIIELTNSDELFKSNAATVSDGRLLASGGSYFIGMECNGQKLRIKSGKSMQVDFPMIKEGEMELFYGERNDNENMNWKRAGTALVPKEDEGLSFTDNNRYYNDFPAVPVYWGGEQIRYRSLNQEVYYYNKRMTIREMVDTINKRIQKVYIDTVYAWPKELENISPDAKVDTAYVNRMYGPRKQFYIKTYRALEQEKEMLARQKAIRDSVTACWHPQTLAGQIQKYYSSSSITALGWINCDRFYRSNENTDMDLDIPITFNNSRIEYFVIFKSINGLINYREDLNDRSTIVLKNLPVGEAVTVIAFTKNNGILYQGKEDFVIAKNKKVAVDFKTITKEELGKIFGKNVKA